MRSPRTVNVSAAWLGVAVVVCSAACGASDGRVVAPMPTGPTVVFPPSFPAVLRPARVYDARGAVSYPLSAWTLGSRYVLY
jgi:hypothetical protein